VGTDGQTGLVLHWDGASWTRVRLAGSAGLTAMSVRSDGVYVLDRTGAIYELLRWAHGP
jgi:hypothetical protein